MSLRGKFIVWPLPNLTVIFLSTYAKKRTKYKWQTIRISCRWPMVKFCFRRMKRNEGTSEWDHHDNALANPRNSERGELSCLSLPGISFYWVVPTQSFLEIQGHKTLKIVEYRRQTICCKISAGQLPVWGGKEMSQLLVGIWQKDAIQDFDLKHPLQIPQMIRMFLNSHLWINSKGLQILFLSPTDTTRPAEFSLV